MTAILDKAAAESAAANASATFDGFAFRNNLSAQGAVPAAAPFNLCPDIIGSLTPISDAAIELTAVASLQEIYDCDPVTAETNYYYLRALNGTDGSTAGKAALYAGPAQLIAFPQTWGTQLQTDSGADSVCLSAPAGHYAVGADPFVWNAPAPPPAGSFYSFVAVSATTGDPVVPPVTDYLGMAKLLTRQLNIGLRTLDYVDATADGWTRAVGLTIPAGFPSASLLLSVNASGFNGCSVGLIANRFTDDRQPIILNPVALSPSSIATLPFTAEPGYAAEVTVQLWNPGGAVASGSTISVSVSYVVPDHEIEEALVAGLDSRYANLVRSGPAGSSVGPTAVLPLGWVTFMAVMPPGAQISPE